MSTAGVTVKDPLNWGSSEVVCTNQMRQIETGGDPIQDELYNVHDVALRYGVTRDAVYRGVRQVNPLYPKPKRQGKGPKPALFFKPAAVKACDHRRIQFYKQTPSWRKFEGLEWEKPPKRISARKMFPDFK
ncbi:MAG: hypothetical protein V4684_09870 [Pseudomonadota bacterium]